MIRVANVAILAFALSLLAAGCAGPIKRSSSPSGVKPVTHTAPLLPGMVAGQEAPVERVETAAVTPTPEPQEQPENAEIPEDLDLNAVLREDASEPTVPQEPTVPDPEADEADEDLQPTVAEKPKAKHQIPFEFNQRVAGWIQYFSQKDRERFQRFLDRGEPYREVIENILEENRVPADLYYLGLIESGFVTHARSHAKAVGVWQFMGATGREYGLSRDSYIDERQDPIRATEAAAKMMRDLYKRFGSWYLAMAAYNAGQGRIGAAVRRAGTNDFWELVERKKLPRETMDYVPKFLAARYIGENPDLFAFYINEERKFPDVELVKVPSPVSFASIEKTAALPAGTLSFVNPAYKKPFTHPGKREDEIWVPENYAQMVRLKSPELGAQRMKIKVSAPVARAAREKVLVYRVKRGDTLKSIARKQGLSVAYLKRVNGLHSSKILPGQQLKVSASSYRQKRAHPRQKGLKRRHR